MTRTALASPEDDFPHSRILPRRKEMEVRELQNELLERDATIAYLEERIEELQQQLEEERDGGGYEAFAREEGDDGTGTAGW